MWLSSHFLFFVLMLCTSGFSAVLAGGEGAISRRFMIEKYNSRCQCAHIYSRGESVIFTAGSAFLYGISVPVS